MKNENGNKEIKIEQPDDKRISIPSESDIEKFSNSVDRIKEVKVDKVPHKKLSSNSIMYYEDLINSAKEGIKKDINEINALRKQYPNIDKVSDLIDRTRGLNENIFEKLDSPDMLANVLGVSKEELYTMTKDEFDTSVLDKLEEMELVDKDLSKVKTVFKEDILNHDMWSKDYSKNDVLKIEKIPPYDLMIKSVYDGIKLDKCLYYTHEYEKFLTRKILSMDKFKNIHVDKNLVNMLIHTDNEIFERKLFYPAFFIDSDFKLIEDRFVIKGMMVFECETVKTSDKTVITFETGIVNDTRVHFTVIDKKRNCITCFGVSLNKAIDTFGYLQGHLLKEYKDEMKVMEELLETVVKIVCNIIDLIEGNKSELDIRYIVPSTTQKEKRERKGKCPITTTVIIRPKRELLTYAEAFEREHRKVRYSHKWIVRGHWRRFNSDFYKSKYGTKTWIKPFVKGRGIFVKKDVLFTDNKENEKEK